VLDFVLAEFTEDWEITVSGSVQMKYKQGRRGGLHDPNNLCLNLIKSYQRFIWLFCIIIHLGNGLGGFRVDDDPRTIKPEKVNRVPPTVGTADKPNGGMSISNGIADDTSQC
jgi:hypothetical protein